MNNIMFVKSFSKGQITIPKEFRENLGIDDDFWLKLYIQEKKIIAEPVEKEKSKVDYLQKVLSIKGGWFSKKDFEATRKDIEKRLKRRMS